MSDRDGARAALMPVAAHMPGGGSAFISLKEAERRRALALEAREALVEARSRLCKVGEVGEVGERGDADAMACVER